MTVKDPEKLYLWEKEWMEWEFNEFIARYNVSPTDRVVIGRRPGGAKAELAKVPWGIKGYDGDLRTIARADRAFELHQKRIQERRCVVFADGFYEWEQRPSGPSQPHHFQLRGGQPFCLAGFYSSTSDGFMILTTNPNELVAKVHTRMPVILDRERSLRWISAETIDQNALQEIAEPWPADQMESFAVSRYVSKSGNEGPQCLEPPSAADTAPRKGKLTASKSDGTQLNLF